MTKTQEMKKDCDVQMRVRDFNASINKCVSYELKAQGIALDAANASLKKNEKKVEQVGLQTLTKEDLKVAKAALNGTLAWYRRWARSDNKGDQKLIQDTLVLIEKVDGLAEGKIKALSETMKKEMSAKQEALAEQMAALQAQMQANEDMLSI